MRWTTIAGRPLLGALLLLALLVLVRCFAPQLPDCSYRCGKDDGTGAPLCPPEYECQSDRYCHRLGSTAACPFSMDLSPPADLRPPADLVSAEGGADGAVDGGGD